MIKSKIMIYLAFFVYKEARNTGIQEGKKSLGKGEEAGLGKVNGLGKKN